MKLDSRLVQRIILAFTTGLFLACAAKVSEQGGAIAPLSAATYGE